MELRYIGRGAFLADVPARDLTQADIDATDYTADELAATDLYDRVDTEESEDTEWQSDEVD